MKKPFFTKRMVITLIGMTLSTLALWKGKLQGGDYVLAMAVFIAGHHAADLVKAWRGGQQ